MERKRGLGPFSGAQLTILISVIVVAFAIATPVTVGAVTGSNVFVTDAGSGVRAAVNGSNQLATTGQPNKMSNWFHSVSVSTSEICPVVATAPSNYALVITRVHVEVITSAPDQVSLTFLGACVGPQFYNARVNTIPYGAGGLATYDLDVPQGIPIAASHTLIVSSGANHKTAMQVSSIGYKISKSDCTAACL